MTNREVDEHWISSTVSLWQLIIALAVAIAAPISFVYGMRSDIIELQTLRKAGVSRNDVQDAEIERLRVIARDNQVAIGKLEAKLDLILIRQDSVIRGLTELGARK